MSKTNFVNVGFSTLEKVLGTVGNLQLDYNEPLKVPQHYKAVGKTTQNPSLLMIQNTSNVFDLTVFVQPIPEGQKPLITIKANDRNPVYISHNWDGALLNVANVSQEAATALVQLTDMG
tara:strand:+ start:22970 stop:23326 length:357 start_codon:yes stop_codon:yes gene_type:complete